MMHRSPLGRARGLGAAGHGVQDWWRQRVSSVALVPLTFWFAASVASLPGQDYEAVTAWIRNPWQGVLLIALLLVTLHHTVQGLQVVIEDYIRTAALKWAALLAVRLGFAFLGLAAVFATLRIQFQI